MLNAKSILSLSIFIIFKLIYTVSTFSRTRHPFDRYAYASYGLAGIMVLAMVGAICYRPLLYCVAPLMLFSLISFIISFLGYGYNMIPAEVRLEMETAGEPLEVMEVSEDVGLTSEKISIIESMLASW